MDEGKIEGVLTHAISASAFERIGPDWLLFVDGVPIGAVEAKKEGETLTGVELQTTKYSEGVPAPTAAIPVLFETSWSEVAALAANPDHPVERDQSVGIRDDSLASVSLR